MFRQLVAQHTISLHGFLNKKLSFSNFQPFSAHLIDESRDEHVKAGAITPDICSQVKEKGPQVVRLAHTGHG